MYFGIDVDHPLAILSLQLSACSVCAACKLCLLFLMMDSLLTGGIRTMHAHRIPEIHVSSSSEASTIILRGSSNTISHITNREDFDKLRNGELLFSIKHRI